jgi:hypothetical protein
MFVCPPILQIGIDNIASLSISNGFTQNSHFPRLPHPFTEERFAVRHNQIPHLASSIFPFAGQIDRKDPHDMAPNGNTTFDTALRQYELPMASDGRTYLVVNEGTGQIIENSRPGSRSFEQLDYAYPQPSNLHPLGDYSSNPAYGHSNLAVHRFSPDVHTQLENWNTNCLERDENIEERAPIPSMEGTLWTSAGCSDMGVRFVVQREE